MNYCRVCQLFLCFFLFPQLSWAEYSISNSASPYNCGLVWGGPWYEAALRRKSEVSLVEARPVGVRGNYSGFEVTRLIDGTLQKGKILEFKNVSGIRKGGSDVTYLNTLFSAPVLNAKLPTELTDAGYLFRADKNISSVTIPSSEVSESFLLLISHDREFKNWGFLLQTLCDVIRVSDDKLQVPAYINDSNDRVWTPWNTHQTAKQFEREMIFKLDGARTRIATINKSAEIEVVASECNEIAGSPVYEQRSLPEGKLTFVKAELTGVSKPVREGCALRYGFKVTSTLFGPNIDGEVLDPNFHRPFSSESPCGYAASEIIAPQVNAKSTVKSVVSTEALTVSVPRVGTGFTRLAKKEQKNWSTTTVSKKLVSSDKSVLSDAFGSKYYLVIFRKASGDWTIPERDRCWLFRKEANRIYRIAETKSLTDMPNHFIWLPFHTGKNSAQFLKYITSALVRSAEQHTD